MKAVMIVNEPGEFHELLQLAMLLRKERSAACTFVFIRPDYAAAERHAEVCLSRGFPYIHADPAFSLERIPFSLGQAGLEDYVPASVAHPDWVREGREWAERTARSPKLANLTRRGLTARALGQLSRAFAVANRVLARWRDEEEPSFVRDMASFRLHLARVRRLTAFAFGIHDFLNPDVVIMGQDFAGSENSVFTRVSKSFGAQIVILPFAMGTTKEINESLYYSRAHHLRGDPLSRLVARRYPQWINAYRGRLLLRAPAAEVIAFELSGVTTPQPWTPQSGEGTLLLPSQQAMDYYARAGVPAGQLRLTGSLNDKYWSDPPSARPLNAQAIRSFERLLERNAFRGGVVAAVRGMLGQALLAEDEEADQAERLQRLRFFLGARFRPEGLNERLWAIGQSLQGGDLARTLSPAVAERLGASPSGVRQRKLVVVSWVTNQFGRKGPALEYKDYEQLSRAWAASLQQASQESDAEVIVSLHPTLDPAAMHYLESEFGLVIWPGRLIEIMAQADLFVACVSSTLLWASNLCVPAINYDAYHYGYREFGEAGSIVSVDNSADFDRELGRMLSDDEYRASWRSRAEERRGYWGCFDGLSESRILAALDEAVARRRSA
ncbi:hypothetical protein ACFODL_16330 [Phenylobacterium terrae]|uniref:Uncharacterized protein n=1 Tax=Phenylobacterium terrae TaxID=2665495 RepID=A0ABW4N3W9_9CAUL